MKPLLAILSYQKANDMVMRHFPWYRKAGCDILGVGREDTTCLWPAVDAQFVGSIKCGRDSYVNGDNLIRLHLEVLQRFGEIEAPFYTHIVLTEPDAIFVKPLPELPLGMMGTPVGFRSDGFHGSTYMHGPWIFDIVTARQVVELGMRMLNCGLIERGFPDRFYGLMLDLWPEIGFTKFPGYSQNRLDRPEYVAQAREAIAQGAYYVHGIKTEQELRAVTEGLI